MKKIYIISIFIFIGLTNLIYSNDELSTENNSFYVDFNEGKDLFSKKQFSEAEKKFEKVVSNGKEFQILEYEEALKKLVYSYIQTESFKKVDSISNQLENTVISDSTKSYISKLAEFSRENLIYINYKNQDWKLIQFYFDKLKNPSEQSKIIYSISLYNTNQLDKLISFLEKESDDCVQMSSILAKTYIRKSLYDKASELYSMLEKQKELKDDDRREYSKILFIQNHHEKAKEQLMKIQNPNEDDFYMMGLCNYNLQLWKLACESFEKVTVQIAKENYINTLYYKGIAYYKLSEIEKSYEALSKVFLSLKETEKKQMASQLLVESCILQKEYEKAEKYAQELINISSGVKKEGAIISLAEIYIDGKNYTKAITLLEKSLKEEYSQDFMLQALIMIAQSYQNSNQLEKADNAYLSIQKQYQGTQQAQHALISRGQMYYSEKKYDLAEKSFTKYLFDYPNGSYADSAYYYSGECSLKAKNYSRCIMQTNNLISKFPKSSYEYGGYKNLLNSYYELENYNQALQVARILLKNFDEQAINDGIGRVVIELEKIISGLPKDVAKKQTEYEEKGSLETVEGRIIGSQLVELYSKYEMEKSAYDLANTLIEKQTSVNESEYAGNNAKFIAKYLQDNFQNEKAAQMYLKAASYYRTANDDKNSAESLYSAVNCFVMANQIGDGEETARILVELYPKSKQALHVGDLLK